MSPRSLKARWLRRLLRIHEVLLHGEVVAKCLGPLALAAEDWGANGLSGVLIRPLFHWLALLLRGTV